MLLSLRPPTSSHRQRGLGTGTALLRVSPLSWESDRKCNELTDCTSLSNCSQQIGVPVGQVPWQAAWDKETPLCFRANALSRNPAFPSDTCRSACFSWGPATPCSVFGAGPVQS